ncbi:MAG TPA: DUF6544 family protein [Anaeromyxobacteraceae bacterium]|nr:DUF6544 family protein [Anaeromyxobacteraceae bacterium]
MPKKLAVAAVVVLALAAAALALADRSNHRAFLADADAAIAAAPRQPDAPVTEADLASLPPPVAAHLRACGVVGARRVSVARLRHGGRFLASDALGWRPITGEYVVTTGSPAFLWYGRVQAAPFVPIVARDGFALGHGRMLVKVFGAIPIVDARGDGMDQAAFARLAAELTLVPTALLPGPNLRWEPIDERSARAHLAVGARRASLVFRRDPGTGETSLEVERGRQEGDALVPRTFRARASGVLRAGGLALPRRVEGSWILPERELEYVDFELEDATFE